jgi:hypothetical protein
MGAASANSGDIMKRIRASNDSLNKVAGGIINPRSATWLSADEYFKQLPDIMDPAGAKIKADAQKLSGQLQAQLAAKNLPPDLADALQSSPLSRLRIGRNRASSFLSAPGDAKSLLGG